MVNKQRAKQLFMSYDCHLFYLDRDGDSELYHSFGPTREDEAAWRQEFIAHWTSQLGVDDLRAVDHLRNAEAVEALPDLLRLAEQGDSYAQLWYANAIWHLLRPTWIDIPLRDEARRTVLRIWQRLVTQPIVLSVAHAIRIEPSLRSLGVATPAEYVRTCAWHQLQRA